MTVGDYQVDCAGRVDSRHEFDIAARQGQGDAGSHMLGRPGRSALRRLAGSWRIEQPRGVSASRTTERQGPWLSAIMVATAVAIAAVAGLWSGGGSAPSADVFERPATSEFVRAERTDAVEGFAVPLPRALSPAPDAVPRAGRGTTDESRVADKAAEVPAKAAAPPLLPDRAAPNRDADIEHLLRRGGHESRDGGVAVQGTGSRVGDPEQAIREYLGLSAFEDLPISFIYQVEPGDNLGLIADRFGLTVASVLGSNPQIADPDLLNEGDEITVPTRDGVLHQVADGETLMSVVNYLNADYDKTLEANGIANPDLIRAGRTMLFVGGERGFSDNSALFSGVRGSLLQQPVVYDEITDRFGVWRERFRRTHYGLDFSAAYGTPVTAAHSGTVSYTGWEGTYGQWVEIDQGNGYKTRYAHLSRIDVVYGEQVVAGERIGTVGSTGLSTGPHLHFELLRQNEKIDPEPFLVLR